MVKKNSDLESSLIHCSIQSERININTEFQIIENYNNIGATCHFVGRVRQKGEKGTLQHLMIEHYPEMTEKVILSYQATALKKWNLITCRVIHRVGIITCNDDIVSVLCASEHRKSAFESCQFIIDNLKVNAPFWKKEIYINGNNKWVLPTSSDYSKNNKWKKHI